MLTRSCQAVVAALLGVMVAACASAGQSGGSAPEAVAKEFYEARIAAGFTGLPEGAALDRIAPMLSSKLKASMAAALAEQKRFMKENPDEKPPWIEGDLFSSLFEGPTSFEVGTSRIEAGRAVVVVNFAYVDSLDAAKPFHWSDTLVLVREGDKWVVDDVEFHGSWDFATKGTLSEGLELEK